MKKNPISFLVIFCFKAGTSTETSKQLTLIDSIIVSSYNSVMIQQLINDEKFINIQKAQAGLTRLLISADKTASFYTVLKNDKPLGTLVPRKMWESLLEDLEALSSPDYRKFIAESRKSKRVTADQIRNLIK